MKAAPSRGRRLLRKALWALGVIVLLHVVAILIGLSICWPFDFVVNVGRAPFIAELQAPADGKRRVVVLQHGLWRMSASLWRLERTLRAHGYEVHNPGYPSTRERVEESSARLAAVVEAIHERPVDELCFVGHSLGGLVIEDYLRRPDARPTAACVYLGTPHRGAILADLRKNWFVFRWSLGTASALQLTPGDPLHQLPLPLPGATGVLVGDVGEGNPSIPGRDDGTVGVEEAMFPGAKATLLVPISHTWICSDPAAIEQVLRFLRHGEFAAAAASR